MLFTNYKTSRKCRIIRNTRITHLSDDILEVDGKSFEITISPVAIIVLFRGNKYGSQ